MGGRIDDLEKSILDLTKEMGIVLPPRGKQEWSREMIKL